MFYRNKRYLLVNTDYFTKWVEAEPLVNIRDVDAKKFVWKNIVTRFEVSHALISDNSLQFDSKAFRRYCCELGITNRYYTSAYPQGNGQAKAVNMVIVNGLKKRLDDAKGRWVKLTFIGIFISVKQILRHVWYLGSHTWVKLTFIGIFISVKQILRHVRSLGPQP